MDFIIIVYIIFGMLPSLTWLSYYLRKDVHPEPKKMIVKVFLWGSLITIPVFFAQIGLKYLLDKFGLNSSSLTYNLIYWFLIIALSEEFFKYLVVRLKVVNSPHLDEPLDVMLYMVVSALGFAAVENILYLFTPTGEIPFHMVVDVALVVVIVRFVGATFLHTLCSSVVGYCLAMSFCAPKKKYFYVSAGIIMAAVLHGMYDFSIINLGGYFRIGIPAIVIIILAFVVFAGFDELKKMKSICLPAVDLPKGDKVK